MVNIPHLRLSAPPQPRRHPEDSAGPPRSSRGEPGRHVSAPRGQHAHVEPSQPPPRQPRQPTFFCRPQAYFLSDHFPFFLFYKLVSSGEIKRFFYGLVQKLLTSSPVAWLFRSRRPIRCGLPVSQSVSHTHTYSLLLQVLQTL